MALMKNLHHPTQPLCKYMRTKASYIPELQDPVFWEQEDPYHQYYCLKTLHNIGPDDDIVCPEACTASRKCYVPLIAARVA